MSSTVATPTKPELQAVDLARLIPGAGPGQIGNRKPPQAVTLGSKITPGSVAPISAGSAVRSGHLLVSLAPAPLQSRMAWKWVTSMAADFSLIGLNWLLLGAVLVPLRELFPGVRLFGYAAGAPFFLLGLALLHAALITLMGYTERLYSAGSDLPLQARILGKSILGATAVPCFAYGLQGAWSTSALFCAAGLLHFGALLTWRWQSVRQQRARQSGGDVRNALIVGAGGVGRSVAAYLEGHPESGRGVYGFLDDNIPIGNGVVGRVRGLGASGANGICGRSNSGGSS